MFNCQVAKQTMKQENELEEKLLFKPKDLSKY